MQTAAEGERGRRLVPGLVAACLLLAGGCTSTPRWGEQATLLPEPKRVQRALRRAALDPHTWVPAAGALVFDLAGGDRAFSDWASSRTPLFGSQRGAGDASDALRTATGVVWAATVAAAPSGRRPREVLGNKGRGLAVESGALLAVGGLTAFLKPRIGRLRPNGLDHESMPSGHTSAATAFASLGRRNADALCLSRPARSVLKGSLTALSALTAYARVEARAHFPSDVLATYGATNFLTIFLHDAFLGTRSDWWLDARPAPRAKGVVLSLGTRF